MNDELIEVMEAMNMISRERIERIAIDALNESHAKHGLKDVMKCNFCTSRAAEKTVAKYIEQALREQRNEITEWLEEHGGVDGAWVADELRQRGDEK